MDDYPSTKQPQESFGLVCGGITVQKYHNHHVFCFVQADAESENLVWALER